MIERHADALARYTVRMASVVTNGDEEPASTPVLALAGEVEHVCVKGALGARCGMSFPTNGESEGLCDTEECG